MGPAALGATGSSSACRGLRCGAPALAAPLCPREAALIKQMLTCSLNLSAPCDNSRLIYTVTAGAGCVGGEQELHQDPALNWGVSGTGTAWCCRRDTSGLSQQQGHPGCHHGLLLQPVPSWGTAGTDPTRVCHPPATHPVMNSSS